VPAVLASVVAYAVVVSLFGHAALFTHAAQFPIVFRHLPLYAVMAVLIAGLAWGFVRALAVVRRLAARLPGPAWLRPAWGGLALGLLATPAIVVFGQHLREPGHGFGLLGGGYGGVQLAISGAPWLPLGGAAVAVMAVLAVAKLLAAALTIGSGGSAGDFGPSLVIGGLAGGAFGRLAALVTGDPSIDPGAFALVGMGAFFGGIAHVPLSALILVCELAGSYDLLVPLMLAEGIAFVALRMHTLYPAQLPSPAESPVHRERFGRSFLERVRVAELMRREPVTCWTPGTPAETMLQGPGERRWQEVFPVLGDGGVLQGLVTRDALHAVALEREVARLTVAADLMEPAVSVAPGDSLRVAAERMVGYRLRELPVLDRGLVVGLVGEAELARAYFGAS